MCASCAITTGNGSDVITAADSAISPRKFESEAVSTSLSGKGLAEPTSNRLAWAKERRSSRSWAMRFTPLVI